MAELNLLEAEQVVLSYVLNRPESFYECASLTADNFLNPANKRIFNVMLELKNQGKDVILPSILEAVDDSLKEYTAKLFSATAVTKPTFLMHVKYLQDKTNRLNVIQKLKDIVEASEDSNFDIYKSLSNIEIAKTVDEKRDFRTSVLMKLENKIKNGGKTDNILTGIADLDDVVGGFAKGGFYVIAGRSSMGKSAFMTSICERLEKNHKIGIISLEMTGEEIFGRMGSVRAHIPYWVIEKGKASAAQFDAFAGAVHSLKNIFLTDKGGLSGFEVLAQIRRFVATNKCDIVFIDHLGIIEFDDKLNRAHAIGKVTAALKSLAKELDIPVVSLCQVNRGVEGKESKRPRLSDLRDSGRIEEDADCVVFLYRPEYYNPTRNSKDAESAELIISKNRNGECRIVECTFNGPFMMFTDKKEQAQGGFNDVD